MRSFFKSILLGGAVLGTVNAQSTTENYTICNWARLRAGVVRDALYLDGGELWWQTAFVDGTTPVVSSDGNVAGDMFRLNFSQPFDTATTNLSALFSRMPKAGGAGNNIAPNYIDGTMFVNDDELYLYGGLAPLTDSSSPQSADAVLGYEADQYGTYRSSWTPGFYQGTLPDGVTRYITNGAGVSAPSENLGFYFSGMRSPDWGPIYYEDSSANVTANTLIEIDMSVMRSEKWTNTTIPDNIPLRANAELVWIPVSGSGVLVAIGGAAQPEEIWASGLNTTQTSEDESQDPGFMTSLPVYDINSTTWYLQNTTGTGPGALTEFCSVVAAANDSSSYNVYIYGGYDGLNADDEPSDDVWILSIPSFTWVKGYSGTTSHGRSGHRCVMPYPDQMFVVGGIHQNQAECVAGGIIQVFNLNTLEFQDTYDPNTWSEYKVPDVVSKVIGGTTSGGSTQTVTWSDSALSGIFSTKYARAITSYYPYPSVSSTNSSSSSSNSTASSGSGSSSKSGGGGGVSKGAIIGIAIAAALILLLILLLLFLLVRRRRRVRSSASEKSSASSNSRITRWINGASCAPTMKQTSPASSGGEVQQVSHTSMEDDPTPPLNAKRHEMAGTERPKPPYELATPYNNDGQPRHSAVQDYGYSAGYGHTYSNTQSSSSGEEYRPSPMTSYNGNGNGTSPLRTVRFPPGNNAHTPAQEVSTPSEPSTQSEYSTTSTATNETPPWPLTPAQNTWRNNRGQSLRFGNHDREGSESSSVQPIMEEPEEHAGARHGTTHAQGPGGQRFSYQHTNESASSGVGTLPSPGGDGEDHRQSLYDRMVSPVSPTVGRNQWRQ
ncbi:hypothetical protein EDD36DRAFT_464174 [Exophiala viscosa]|uniref:Kelch repeat protein n=1 Tax=Exophiala viscosa TaxID=2486360 RepID=A0AAN6IDW7_9EURO|nr:hypothetical protein EDD36DRAFT_464174 [Exophiala viscosa]